MSAATYYRRIRPDPRTFLPLMALAFVGSAAGALVASQIPREAFEPIVLVALIVVGAYVCSSRRSARRPRSGSPATGTPPRRWLTGLGDRLLRRRARPGHRQLLRVHPGRAARLPLPRGLGEGPAGELGHQPRRALRLRAAGRGALEGRPADGRLQPRRRLPRRPHRRRARRQVRPGVLHRRRLGVHRPDRRRGVRVCAGLAVVELRRSEPRHHPDS